MVSAAEEGFLVFWAMVCTGALIAGIVITLIAYTRPGEPWLSVCTTALGWYALCAPQESLCADTSSRMLQVLCVFCLFHPAHRSGPERQPQNARRCLVRAHLPFNAP
jgi:hypothetical protein